MYAKRSRGSLLAETTTEAVPTMTADSDDIARHADQLYAARSALAEAKRPTRRFGVGEIVQFLSDPSRTLTAEEQRALFTNPRLRDDYRRLKAQATTFELPALAAASSGAVNARRFEGGTISIHPSRVPGQIYVILRFTWPTNAPRMILLESAAGDLLKRALPAADAQGEVMMVLNERSDADAGFLRLLADPTSTGTFVL
jgi:hypothetical protein